MRRWRLYLLVVLVALLTACSPGAPGLTPQAFPTLAVPSPDERFPIAQPLTEEQIENLDDGPAHRVLLQDRERAKSKWRQKRPPSSSWFLGPRLVPSSPASLIPGWVDQITVPAGQVLEGYLDMAAVVRGKEECDFLVMLLVDYRQVPFELGGNLAPAHLVRLPAWKVTTFPFRLPEPLPEGSHDLLFVMHNDPYNIYATAGVLEKYRHKGKITFDAASDRPFDNPIAIRHYVFVGEKAESPATNFMAEPFKPRKTDLLNVPLLLSLTGEETDPLIGCEPAVVAGSDDLLYAFVYYDFAPPEGPLSETTAALVAILDDRQVRVNGREALFFRVQSGQRYRFPLEIDWPAEVMDGQVHALYFGIAFGVGEDWQGKKAGRVD